MVVVFAVFVVTGVPSIKEIGLGLRGRDRARRDPRAARPRAGDDAAAWATWNWWMPEWLGRILPEVDFESDHAVDDERAPAVV